MVGVGANAICTPANQPINLKGIFLWDRDIDLSISARRKWWKRSGREFLIPVDSIILVRYRSIEWKKGEGWWGEGEFYFIKCVYPEEWKNVKTMENLF